MPNTEIYNALAVAETIRALLAKSELKQKDNTQSIGKVTVSIGILHCSVNTLNFINPVIPEVFNRESIAHNGFLLKAYRNDENRSVNYF